MSKNWFQELFINEAKPALKRHSGGGGSGREPVLNEKEITENGVYTPPKGVDGFSKVDVDVPIPDGYIQPSGTKNITSNGTHDVTQYSSTNVNVPVPDGYIRPSGTKNITSNGTHDVTQYSSTNVNVPVPDGYIVPEGSIEIVENGTYEVAEYSEVVVDVPSSGGEGGSSLKKLLDSTKSCYQLCKGSTLDSFEGVIEFEDTSNVTNMSYMFDSCKNISSVPLLDTSNVTSMTYMFNACTNISSIPLFDTSNVTNMWSMFMSCLVLTSVPLFDTSNVTNMENMFSICRALANVPLLDTSNVTSMRSMFQDCNSLTSVPLFDTRNVTDMSNMFYSCWQLNAVPLFDTSKVTRMYNMFGGTRMKEVPLFDTSKVTDMGSMFNKSHIVTVPAFDMRSVTNAANTRSMFNSCNNLTACMVRNVSTSLQVGSGDSYGYKLTMESLLNLLNETRYYSSGSRTLTVGTSNLAKFTGDYACVRKTGEIVDVDDNPCELTDGCKVRVEWCAADAEGAISITDYMAEKGWQIA